MNKKICAIVWNFLFASCKNEALEITEVVLFGKETSDVDLKNKNFKAFCYFKFVAKFKFLQKRKIYEI